jgi:MFS family permease
MSKQIESGSSRPNSMKKIAFASMIGTLIEFYDFLIYGTAAALVFAKAFFPSLGHASGSVLALATFGVAFIARPLGSVIFGHFGDRIGRKKTLVSTFSSWDFQPSRSACFPPPIRLVSGLLLRLSS